MRRTAADGIFVDDGEDDGLDLGSDRGDGQPRSTKTEEDRAAHRAAGLRVALSAGTYSPDYNPMEEAFAKIKNLLLRKGKAVARSIS
jgi:hypothetical protein